MISSANYTMNRNTNLPGRREEAEREEERDGWKEEREGGKREGKEEKKGGRRKNERS